jgi:hypothetical protein
MSNFRCTLIFSLSLIVSSIAIAGQSPTGNATAKAPTYAGAAAMPPGFVMAPKGSRVFFANLKNRQTIPTKFKVKFGVEGMKIQPAGELVTGTGHHHLIIDGNSVPMGQIVLADATHIHFGKGQTEAEIELAPGPHKLTLQFANGVHASYGPELADTVDVVVK